MSAKPTTHPHSINWGYIFWRDRLWTLSSIIISLIIALILLALYPRDYVATIFITAPLSEHRPKIEWQNEARYFSTTDFLKALNDQRGPIQSTKSFDSFKPLKLDDTIKSEHSPAQTLNAKLLSDKITVFVDYTKDQTPIGLRLDARSTNEAEAMMLARLAADSYTRLRHDEITKQQAQHNGWIRAEILKRQKTISELEAVKTQYEIEHAGSLIDDETLYELRQEEIIKTKARIAQYKTRYGAKHPVMIELNESLKELESPHGKSRAADSLIKQTIDQLNNTLMIQKNDLSQFVQQNGAGLSRLKIMQDREFLQTGMISIKPDKSFDRALILSFAALGLLLGLTLCMLKQTLYPTLQNALDLAKPLQSLPFMHLNRLLKPTDSVLAFKTLRRDLQLRFHDPKLCVLTSDTDDRILTETAYGLARVSAGAGEKIMLIDMNWHKASLHHLAHNHKKLSMVDYLTGTATLDTVLNRDDPSGTHILYGSDVPMTAIDLIAGNKLANLLLSFRQIYDLVIMIAPPVTPYADTKILSKLSDLTLLMAFNDLSENARLIEAQETLTAARIDKIGLVFVE